MEDTNKIASEINASIDRAENLDSLEHIRIAELGKSGRVTALMKTLGKLDPTERKSAGKKFNELKNAVLELIDTRKLVLERAGIEGKLAKEKIDITLPERPEYTGSIHPISQTIDEIRKLSWIINLAEDNSRNFRL